MDSHKAPCKNGSSDVRRLLTMAFLFLILFSSHTTFAVGAPDPPGNIHLTWDRDDAAHTISITWETSTGGSGDTVLSTLGSTDGVLAAWSCRFGSGTTWRLQYNDTHDIWEFKGNNLTSARAFLICDVGNSLGRPAGFMDFGTMGFGLNGTAHTAASSEPTTGTYAKGDIVFNNAPAPGGWVGWIRS